MMNKILFTACTVFTLSAGQAGAALIDTSLWDVTNLSGPWSAGSTGWNLVGLKPDPTTADAEALLSDGYVDNFDQTTVNGIYAYPDGLSSLTFGTGGVDYLLNTFAFITSRNYSNSTEITLDYRLDGGAWINAVTTVTGSLLAPLSSCLNDGGNLCPGQTVTMSFGGVLADEWRWSRTSGNQVSLHEVMIDGQLATVSVPEPATIAMLGLGLAGLGFMRKLKKA